MANVFLDGNRDNIETAILLEKAIIHDIGNSVAYIDEKGQMFINTEDNLNKILPSYNTGMLKWLLWHEKYHDLLRHHKRYFKFVDEFEKATSSGAFTLTHQEVNIIMDILVHDTLSILFPELIETARTNLAQFRDSNSLGFTFTTNTLEEMLDEYKKYKKDPPPAPGTPEPSDEPSTSSDKPSSTSDAPAKSKSSSGDDKTGKKSKDTGKRGHGAGGGGTPPSEDSERVEETPTVLDEEEPPKDRHDEVDWSKLEAIDSKEFLSKPESAHLQDKIQDLRNKKLRLAKLTETLNGLATSTRKRTYAMPSTIQAGKGIILKGRQPGRAMLYLCFDASGSMGHELQLFKEIISKTIPQAMDTPCQWFSGYTLGEDPDVLKRTRNPEGRSSDYFKGTFRDMMHIYADDGYNDDGDRTIELCWQAEQLGYSPIGVTDGGGRLSWSKKKLKELKRTILVCPSHSSWWLEEVKAVNPNVQTLEV